MQEEKETFLRKYNRVEPEEGGSEIRKKKSVQSGAGWVVEVAPK